MVAYVGSFNGDLVKERFTVEKIVEMNGIIKAFNQCGFG